MLDGTDLPDYAKLGTITLDQRRTFRRQHVVIAFRSSNKR